MKTKYFPNSEIEILRERLNFLKLRIKFRERLYFDIYYNSSNDRIDFALIMEGKRTFGYDNLGGWHKHPVENPEMHKYCEKPDIEEVFREIRDIISDLVG